MRIGIGGIFHETSTYATQVLGTVGAADFTVTRGAQVLDAHLATGTEVGGAMRAAERLGITLVPLMLAMSSPGPTIDGACYRSLADELVRTTAASLPLDGILLVLHGAGVAEGVPSIEIDLVRQLRGVVGPIPIVATLDLHANLGSDWASSVDASFPCRQYPHTDLDTRADEALSALHRLVDTGLHVVTACETVPVICTAGCTDDGVMAESIGWCLDAMAADESVLDVSILHGFPFTDVSDAGMHVLASRVDGDRAAAAATARALAERLWDRRGSLVATALSAEAAVAAALDTWRTDGGPVVINETSDNPGGGAPGDGTHLLRALIDAGAVGALFGCIFDPEVAAAAHAAGPGERIDVRLGARYGSLHGRPIEAVARVAAVTDGRCVAEGPIAAGSRIELGPSALITIDGIDVVITSRAEQVWDASVFRTHGVDPEHRPVVAVKSSTHFRAAFGPMATAVFTADPPGLTALDVSCLPRHHHRRPLWPLDPSAGLDDPERAVVE
ncbi:MAG: M81 family metallopeptidase [Acidimicrobiales bacterium]